MRTEGRDEDEEDGLPKKEQYLVFLPSGNIKKKIIPHCYNVYRPKQGEKD